MDPWKIPTNSSKNNIGVDSKVTISANWPTVCSYIQSLTWYLYNYQLSDHFSLCINSLSICNLDSPLEVIDCGMQVRSKSTYGYFGVVSNPMHYRLSFLKIRSGMDRMTNMIGAQINGT
jgi:hypothetical protein